jgi:hypothetical protein
MIAPGNSVNTQNRYYDTQYKYAINLQMFYLIKVLWLVVLFWMYREEKFYGDADYS